MPHPFRLLPALGLLLAAGPAAASKVAEAIDRQLNACLETNESTLGIRECYGTAHQAMDERLNKVYKALMKILPKPSQDQLRDAQRKWLQYREAELALSLALDPANGGSLARINSSTNAYRMLKQRVEELESYKLDQEEGGY